MFMKYRVLGKTGIKASIIGCGGSGLGGVFGAIEYETAKRIVDYCLSVGINYFDTSPMYGNSE